jgi:flagella basal body P-ring formation protein FlgA
MTRCKHLVALAPMLLAPLAAARAAEEPLKIALKEKAVVASDTIELRDVAELPEQAPEGVAHLCLGNSPWPGHSREVTRVLVKVRLVGAGLDLDGFAFGGSDVCLVEPASVAVEPEQLVEAARGHLAAQFPGRGAGLRIELLQSAPAVFVPAQGGPIELRPCLQAANPPAGNVRVDVDVVRDGERLRRVPLSFSVALREQVAVTLKPVAQGDLIRPADVTFAERDVAALGRPCVTSLKELHGMVAARPLRAGQVVERRLLSAPEAPVVINHNQRVFLVVDTGTLRAVTVGKSLGRARLGELARARNLSSGREVVGVAMENSTIRILLEGLDDES